MPPPNLLLITTDQQTHAAMACAGDPHLATPNLDALAERGTRCTHALVPFPVCVPSRTALQYGCWPHQVLLPGNEQIGGGRRGELGEVAAGMRERELGHLLSAAGYRCGWAGKWHVGTWGPTESLGDFADTGFEALCPIDDEAVPVACEAFIARVDDRPFCLVASFDDPHNIHEWQREVSLPWGDLPEPPARSQLPPLPRNHGREADEPHALTRYREQRDAACDVDGWRRYRWAYHRLVERVDARIGAVLAALDRAGRRDDTLIVFTSDHGECAGSHDFAFKHVLYDESVRVPLIVAGPDIAAGATCDALISTGLDVHATLAAAAGVDLKGDGIDLRTQLAEPASRRAAVCAETRFPSGVRARLVRDHRWAYIAYEQGPHPEQLFDCIADPGQRVDLATCAAYDEQRRRLRETLREWMRATDDRFNAGHYAHPESRIVLPGDAYRPA